MDVIRRISGRSFARERASNRAKDWPVPAQGFRFPGIARPRDAASPRGAEGESAGTALRNTTHPLRDLGWPVHAGEVPTRAAGVPGATVHRDPRTSLARLSRSLTSRSPCPRPASTGAPDGPAPPVPRPARPPAISNAASNGRTSLHPGQVISGTPRSPLMAPAGV